MKKLPDSSQNTPTTAGAKVSDTTRTAVRDVINQMFAEFELVYHNQYLKAFPTNEKLAFAKKLWYSHLVDYPPAAILDAVRRATRESEYLPTVRGVLKYLESAQHLGVPDARSAYQEACRAPSPKQAFAWSHPLVFHAGAACDWSVLASAPENVSWPLFEKQYVALCRRLLLGEEFQLPTAMALPDDVASPPMSREQRQKALDELRKNCGI